MKLIFHTFIAVILCHLILGTPWTATVIAGIVLAIFYAIILRSKPGRNKSKSS